MYAFAYQNPSDLSAAVAALADADAKPLAGGQTLIPTMNADKPPKQSKVMGTKKWFDPHSEGKGLNATDGKTTPTAYPLKKSYEK